MMEVLEKLTVQRRGMGLKINEKKTKIIKLGKKFTKDRVRLEEYGFNKVDNIWD